jgi:hypothetical protein
MLTLKAASANQKLTALRKLWEQKRGRRAMPARADLTVTDLRPWLGNLALLDLEARGEVFRLCGVNLFSRFGGDQTGQHVADLRGDGAHPFRNCVSSVRQARAPVDQSHMQIIHGEQVTFEELALPLTDGGAEMKIVLFASYLSPMQA